ncbi:DNA-binding protein YbiB [Uliginosibacterium sediminicola]|uniref:DNA-binding protein YbiB n=1 Tax=Uliginosibacterium sediminicola TaxID=2024550 RepID=A0ABU9YWA7_9RHOO
MEYARIIKEIGRGIKGARPLSQQDACALFTAIIDGIVPDMELGAILLSLRIKGEELDELLGFKAAMDARGACIQVPEGPRCVILPTYNGARKQANLMPLVASLLARRGVPVLIQGRHDFDSRVSPFALLEKLGIETCSDLQQASAQLARDKLACVPLASLLPGLDRLLALRPRLGLRNSGHTLAKLLDPCPGRSVRVVAVTHPEYLERMEQFLIAEKACALLMRGTEGEAYASPRRRPRLLGFSEGQASELFEQASAEAPPIGEAECELDNNAESICRMLSGELETPQPILDQVAALAQLAQA